MKNSDWDSIEGMKSRLPGHRYVQIEVESKNNDTGEIRTYRKLQLLHVDEDYPDIGRWEDGDYMCDCVRAADFALAKGEPDPNISCGDSLYSVRLRNPKTGEYYYSEF